MINEYVDLQLCAMIYELARGWNYFNKNVDIKYSGHVNLEMYLIFGFGIVSTVEYILFFILI